MSIFSVEQLTGIAESGNYFKIPEFICAILAELETKLDIVEEDNSTTSSSSGAGAGSGAGATRHFRKDSSSQNRKHGSNRSEVDSIVRGSSNRYDTEALVRMAERPRRNNNNNERKAAEDAEDWATMRTFKTTKIETKTGTDKTINDIRVALNKMSTANYEKQKGIVLTLVSEVGEKEDIKRVSKALFDIASTNKFYSEIYANLYRELLTGHPVFRELLDEFVVGFTNMESIPVYVDPDKDYDGFCVYSKACDVRKSTTTFLTNCAKLGLIAPEQVAHILCGFLTFINANIGEEGKVKVVEEIVENAFVIATLCKTELKLTANWTTDILGGFKTLVGNRGAGLPSFSNRAAFKCMDILDNISS
jgi:hypothetical protein